MIELVAIISGAVAIITGIILAVLIVGALSNRRSYANPRFWGGGGI